MNAVGDYLLEATDLKMHFPIKTGVLRRTIGHVKAVDGVDLTLQKGETLGLVGESGCGKSTLARLLLRLLEPTGGSLFFEGDNILTRGRKQMVDLRRDLQIIFQDPYASLNPRATVGRIIAEPLRIHGYEGNVRRRVQELLELVGLNPEHYNRYPHEFSGGQRQRVGVARAISMNPKLIVCDEPISALDVSIRAQIINLLQDLQQEFDLTYIFIAHDLSIVRYVADRTAVMYLGKIVEMAENRTLYASPKHPYTWSLLSAVPIPDPEKERQRQPVVLSGDVPSASKPPSGCTFHTRCPRSQPYCVDNIPELKPRGDTGNLAACHFPILQGEQVDKPTKAPVET